MKLGIAGDFRRKIRGISPEEGHDVFIEHCSRSEALLASFTFPTINTLTISSRLALARSRHSIIYNRRGRWLAGVEASGSDAFPMTHWKRIGIVGRKTSQVSPGALRTRCTVRRLTWAWTRAEVNARTHI